MRHPKPSWYPRVVNHHKLTIGVGAALLASAAIQAAMQGAGMAMGGDNQEQRPLETPEQASARKKLLEFAGSGRCGDFKVGDAVPLSYGDYNATPQEM